MRGERATKTTTCNERSGSSPHARGTLSEQTAYGLNPRFIPACAGNAHRWATLLREAAVHPRMRGERFEHPLLGGFNLGSSPHARGTPERRWPTCRLHRFIPACAGNAGEPGIWTRSMTVHPRMRGERRRCTAWTTAFHGSSPHARGTLRSHGIVQTGSWFIPACAGNAVRACWAGFPRTVHPRMRGERAKKDAKTGIAGGSSPHARGTHFQ